MDYSNKIYLTSLHMKHGGVEMVIASLANGFVQRGFDVEILCTYQLGEPAYPLDDRVKVSYLTNDSPNREAFAEAVQHKNPFGIIREGLRAIGILHRKKSTMKKAIKSIQDGTVISTRHEHSLLLSRYGAPQVKKIAQLHCDHQFDPKFIRGVQTGYQNIDYFVLLTSQTQKEVEGFLKGHVKPQCVTIPNFIDPPPNHLPTQKKHQVMAAGRLHPDKDFASLLRIWAKVAKSHPDWILKIAGEGLLEQSLKQQSRDLEIENQVCFTGPLPHDELLEEMAISSCYALTSVSESFGLVLVEAMSCKTPPVAFDVRVGPASILEDGKSGFLVPDRDEDVFAQRLCQLMDNAVLRDQMGQKAAKRAEDFYCDKVLDQWMHLLRS